MKFKTLAVSKKEDLIFGNAPCPVMTRRGLCIGKNAVYPELNFTLPPMHVNKDTLPEIKNHYIQIVREAMERAMDLYNKGLVFEFETLLEMTLNPDLGIELVKVMNDVCEEYYQKYGLPSAIRLTPNDLRDFERPPRQRTSRYLEQMFTLFDKGAKAGADILSIESTGGKEISDEALMMCDIKKFIFSQAVLGIRDMKMLWRNIVEIAKANEKIAGGDSACGFGNTAMVLADKKYIPKIFAAVARIATVVRSLVAVEEGACGPDKDCAYEGPFLKAIAGIPISMEGKTAACAHLSPVGNIAAACADLWSNESVQNVRLLAGNAPLVYYEQLEYDVRLFNEAIRAGKETSLVLQNLFVKSDSFWDPQALILAPEHVIDISSEIIKADNYVSATKNACLRGVHIIEESLRAGKLKNDEKETPWIDVLRSDIESIPDNEEKFIEEMLPLLDRGKILLEEYGISF